MFERASDKFSDRPVSHIGLISSMTWMRKEVWRKISPDRTAARQHNCERNCSCHLYRVAEITARESGAVPRDCCCHLLDDRGD